MKCVSRIIAMRIVLACIAATAAGSSAADQNAKVKCVNSIGQACAVPLFALYGGDVTRYVDFHIITTGFLRRIGQDHLLFPDESMARFAVSEQAFLLTDMEGEFKHQLGENDQMYVQITGKLHLSERSKYWAEFVLERPPQVVPIYAGDDFSPPPPPPAK